jgi:hypothetical protein
VPCGRAAAAVATGASEASPCCGQGGQRGEDLRPARGRSHTAGPDALCGAGRAPSWPRVPNTAGPADARATVGPQSRPGIQNCARRRRGPKRHTGGISQAGRGCEMRTSRRDGRWAGGAAAHVIELGYVPPPHLPQSRILGMRAGQGGQAAAAAVREAWRRTAASLSPLAVGGERTDGAALLDQSQCVGAGGGLPGCGSCCACRRGPS